MQNIVGSALGGLPADAKSSVIFEASDPVKGKVVILGCGAWGTALANLATANHTNVIMWSRSASGSLADAVHDAAIIVCAIAMKGVSDLVQQLSTVNLSDNTIIVTTSKGLDPDSCKTASQLFSAQLPSLPIVVLSGPNLSKEIEQGLPAATLLASQNQSALLQVKALFCSEYFRIYLSDDPLGAELGGALKNVLAIAVGVCDGLVLGANAKAALMTRFLPELTRLGLAMGAASGETFQGLSGLGDILATCGSVLSRNYRVGFHLAQGLSLEQITRELGGVAEGVPTARVAATLAVLFELSMPITSCVDQLLQQKLSPKEALQVLLKRELAHEYD